MNIYSAIIGVMGDIGAIGKEKKNSQQGFMYRGVDDVMNALQPLLVKHKVFIVPNIIKQEREERQTKTGGNLIYSVCDIEYTFYADDGSSVKCTVTGEGMDSGDKATNKAMAIAFKYACFQVFCIPTEEMKDPDGECHNVKPKSDPQADMPEGEKIDPNKKIEAVHISHIKSQLKEIDRDFDAYLTYKGFDKATDITLDEFTNDIKPELEDWVKKHKKAAKK